MGTHTFFISCQVGFEEMVKAELLHLLAANSLAEQLDHLIPKHLPVTGEARDSLYRQLTDTYNVQVKVGGVSADLPLATAYQFILWSRIASRVLVQLTSSYVGSDLELYNVVYALPWNELLRDGFELMVNFNGTTEALKNSHYSSLKVKDAIVDYYVNQGKERPTVNTDEPTAIIDCRLHRDKVVVSLDLTGSMHKRYRYRSGTAPMRETLGANLILRTGWDKESPVYNPMCGSGVLGVEAAMIALNRAPGLLVKHRPLTHWLGHDNIVWQQVVEQARASELTIDDLPNFRVYGSDNDLAVVLVAKANARLAGVEDACIFSDCELRALTRDEEFSYSIDGLAPTGLVIVNPPYGVRLGNERILYNLYYEMGVKFKQLFPGWIVGIIASNEKLLAATGLSSDRTWKIKNSNLDCIYKVYGLRHSISNNHAVNHAVHQAVQGVAASQVADAKEVQAAQDAAILVDGQTTPATDAAPAEALPIVNFYDIDANELSLYNRLHKNAKRLHSYLQRNDVQNYRIYDADIPEYNLAVDVYTNVMDQQKYYVVQEYAAGKDIPLHKSLHRLAKGLAMVHKFALDTHVTGTPEPQVIDKVRERQRGSNQYNKIANESLRFAISEYDLLFIVNLTDYIDTGIFLDNRDLRYFLRQFAPGANFLNLFAYTGTATCHAIKGGAASSTTVDMSNLYCKWTADHFKLNVAQQQLVNHQIVRANVLSWLDQAVEASKTGYYPELVLADDGSDVGSTTSTANDHDSAHGLMIANEEEEYSASPARISLIQKAKPKAKAKEKDGDRKFKKDGNSKFSDRKFKKYGDRKFGDRKFDRDDDRKFKKDGDRKFGDRKFDRDGDRKFGDRKFGNRKFDRDGDRKFGDRKFDRKDDRKFDRDGERKFGYRKFDRKNDRKFDRQTPLQGTETILRGAAHGQPFVPFDLVFCDPPTFSNSKTMDATWDVQRDHVKLIAKIKQIMSPTGKLVFCNNKRGFKLDYEALEALGLEAYDITYKTMPDDFKGSNIHQAWLIQVREVLEM